MTDLRCLVVAKAPVPGQVKTRLGADIGLQSAAGIASAALLDTVDVCADAFGPDRCHLALAGDLEVAVDGKTIAAALSSWTVFPQSGDGFGARLAHAHGEVAAPVLQIGMDTPQVTAALLTNTAERLDGNDAVLGRADDGGWWVLVLRDPAHARVLADVPMSTPDTHDLTRAALRDAGLTVTAADELRDVDTVEDAVAVAEVAPDGRFGRAWSAATTTGVRR